MSKLQPERGLRASRSRGKLEQACEQVRSLTWICYLAKDFDQVYDANLERESLNQRALTQSSAPRTDLAIH